jgi:hypothetical protein
MIDKKISKYIAKVSTGSTDAEVLAMQREDLDAWLSEGKPDDDVPLAVVKLGNLAVRAFGRPAYRALAEAPTLGWSLLREYVTSSAVSALAMAGWQNANNVRAPRTMAPNELLLTWAGAYVLDMTALEQQLRTFVTSTDLSVYPWTPAMKSNDAPAQFALELAASLAGTTVKRYTPGAAPYLGNEPVSEKSLRALLDYHYEELGQKKKTTAFISDPFALVPFEVMAAAKRAGIVLDFQHPLLWFPPPAPPAPTEHSAWLRPVIAALEPWATRAVSSK